jgi:phosphoketolase
MATAVLTQNRQDHKPRVKSPLAGEELKKIDAYWRAANYLSVGQIYLYDNPLLKRPLTGEHVKPRLLGHWGTTPGLNFIYVHLNRVIKKIRSQHDLHRWSRTRRTGAGS